MDDVSDDILSHIFMRIDSHVSLIRSAAVCKRWRRTIANTTFLCQFCSLHSSAIAGNYHYGIPSHVAARTSVGLVFVPSSPSIHTRHFSLDFLPSMIDFPCHWNIQDSRSILLLMHSWKSKPWPHKYPDMLVCEPLTRCYRSIPPLMYFNDDFNFWASYLIDGDDDEANSHIGITNFRVLCLFICRRDNSSFATVFNEAGGVGSSWIDKSIGDIVPLFRAMVFLGYNKNSWYYFYAMDGILATLNKSTGEFSASLMPSMEDWSGMNIKYSISVGVVDSRDGMQRIIVIFEDNSAKVFARRDGGKWALERSVLLLEVARGLSGYQSSYF